MTAKLRWGVLGVSNFAVNKIVPAMRSCALCEIAAIASRDADHAARAAASLGIPKSHGSYEALLADPEIDVIYNPLPNHLHVPWSIKALEAGKHVLCEKPLAPSTDEVRQLIAVRDRTGLQAGEAFMVRTHPQWQRVREIIDSGEIGKVRTVQTYFSYFNRDPKNVRNVAGYGGGGLLDIGCYAIFVSRLVFGETPKRAAGIIELDPEFQTDRLASAVLDFPSGQAVFTCSTQMVPSQRVFIFGDQARIEVEIPFNAPPDRPCRIWVDTGSDLFGAGRREEIIPVCDQYTVQGDAFSRAVLGRGPVPVPLEDSLRNVAVIEAVVSSSQSGGWQPVQV